MNRLFNERRFLYVSIGDESEMCATISTTTTTTTTMSPSTLEFTWLVVGGITLASYGGVNDVEVLSNPSSPIVIPDYPMTAYDAFGLLDQNRRPVVCGGYGPDPRKCYTYDGATWVDTGLRTQRDRRRASAVGLADGTYWIIGGTGWVSSSEVFFLQYDVRPSPTGIMCSTICT